MIPVTLRHVFDFGAERAVVGDDLVRPDAWDALRMTTSGPFSLPATRAAWEAQVDARADIIQRAQGIHAWAQQVGARRLASYGVGGASMELALWRADPTRTLVLTEYGPQTVARLQSVFPEAEVVHHDLRRDGPVVADAHILHRVDTELDNRAWRAFFARFERARLLVVAADVLDTRTALFEIRSRLLNRHATQAGWLRNAAALERLWHATHVATPVALADLSAWDLRPG